MQNRKQNNILFFKFAKLLKHFYLILDLEIQDDNKCIKCIDHEISQNGIVKEKKKKKKEKSNSIENSI